MRYGHFDDVKREYVITRPDTPLPWINYLGCEEYFGLISNTAGGYSFYRDARLRRLTRYRYNNAPLDFGGRYLFLRDNVTGDYWSPSWMPTRRKLQDYTCRHGLGYSIIGSTYEGIKAETLYFVPLGETLEVWQVTLTNQREEVAALSVFSSIEFCLWDAQDDATNFQRNFSTGQVEVEDARHLSQDRISRTARSLCVLRVQRTAGRFRYAARDLPGSLSGLARADRRGAGRVGQLDRAWLAADGIASRQGRVAARRIAHHHLRAGLS